MISLNLKVYASLYEPYNKHPEYTNKVIEDQIRIAVKELEKKLKNIAELDCNIGLTFTSRSGY